MFKLLTCASHWLLPVEGISGPSPTNLSQIGQQQSRRSVDQQEQQVQAPVSHEQQVDLFRDAMTLQDAGKLTREQRAFVGGLVEKTGKQGYVPTQEDLRKLKSLVADFTAELSGVRQADAQQAAQKRFSLTDRSTVSQLSKTQAGLQEQIKALKLSLADGDNPVQAAQLQRLEARLTAVNNRLAAKYAEKRPALVDVFYSAQAAVDRFRDSSSVVKFFVKPYVAVMQRRMDASIARNTALETAMKDAFARDPQLRLKSAQDPNTRANLLHVLVQYADESRYDDPADKLAAQKLASALVHNPTTNGSDVTRALQLNPSLDNKFAASLHPHAEESMLHQLATEGGPDAQLRYNVATNKNVSMNTLDALAQDPDDHVREAVANNYKTGTDTLTKMATDADPMVREAVARHPNTFTIDREKLVLDPNPFVSAAAVKALDFTDEHSGITHRGDYMLTIQQGKQELAQLEQQIKELKAPEDLSSEEQGHAFQARLAELGSQIDEVQQRMHAAYEDMRYARAGAAGGADLVPGMQKKVDDHIHELQEQIGARSRGVEGVSDEIQHALSSQVSSLAERAGLDEGELFRQVVGSIPRDNPAGIRASIEVIKNLLQQLDAYGANGDTIKQFVKDKLPGYMAESTDLGKVGGIVNRTITEVREAVTRDMSPQQKYQCLVRAAFGDTTREDARGRVDQPAVRDIINTAQPLDEEQVNRRVRLMDKTLQLMNASELSPENAMMVALLQDPQTSDPAKESIIKGSWMEGKLGTRLQKQLSPVIRDPDTSTELLRQIYDTHMAQGGDEAIAEQARKKLLERGVQL